MLGPRAGLARTLRCGHILPCSPLQVGRRSIINKLFFDLAQEEEGVLDAEFLKVPELLSS